MLFRVRDWYSCISTSSNESPLSIFQQNINFSPTGRIPLHTQLEQLTTRFLGTEDTLLCAAGFATNELNLPALLSNKCIVFSDEKNHASLILGLKTSKAKILKYAHNGIQEDGAKRTARIDTSLIFFKLSDLDDLQLKLKDNVLKNENANGELFSKIVIVTEGIYSVDGTILHLPKLIELKKKYKVSVGLSVEVSWF